MRSVDDPRGAFGTLMQSVGAGQFLGKRVRLAAFVRTSDVNAWSGLWLRVDRKSGAMILDNMEDRPIRGTTEWSEHHVVLDVPADAVSLNFGVLQTGSGTTWLDDVRLEAVDSTVPTTLLDAPANQPSNLGFDD
jgi:hypothetical protein